MKFLIFFAVAAFIGSVHCDKECFRAVFKECVREPVPLDRMTLCDEILYQVKCIAHKALDCSMPFMMDAFRVLAGMQSICNDRKYFSQHKDCFAKSLNATKCVEPMNEILRGIKTQEEFIRANKKTCTLIDSYEDCALEEVDKNCHDVRTRELFDYMYKPFRKLNNGFCEELILPADEKDSRPDNFGVLNVYSIFPVLFATV